MNTVIEKAQLERILDQALQDVTERTAGVRLNQGTQSLGEDLCTVHITFDKGFRTSLTLCADTSLLLRMACHSFHQENLEPEYLEEFSKEYFNMLCGKIAVAMYQQTKIPAHFGPPVFYHGRYEPTGQDVHFVLTYCDEHREGVQLIHHVPASDSHENSKQHNQTQGGITDEETNHVC